MKKQPQPQPIIVTTLYKGVFFGHGIVPPAIKVPKAIRITDAQMCLYWSEDVKGILGLASTGPTRNCKIGPSVPAITLTEITSIIEVSQQAELAWKQQPWN